MHEIVRWVAALSALAGFGLALGVNPALYGATADMLAREANVWRRLAWMVGGLATGATVLVLVLRSFDPTNLVALLRTRFEEALITRSVDLVVGVVFLLGAAAVVVWRVRRPTLAARRTKTPPASAHGFRYFTLGLTCSVVGFTTLPIMYLTGRVASSLGPDPVSPVLGYVVFLIALGAPFFFLAWVWRRFPTLSHRVAAVYSAVLEKDYRFALAALLAVSGLVFLGMAVFL